MTLPQGRWARHAGTTFSPDSKLVASSPQLGSIVNVEVWDPLTGALHRNICMQSCSSPKSLAFSQDGKLLAGGNRMRSKFGTSVQEQKTAASGIAVFVMREILTKW